MPSNVKKYNCGTEIKAGDIVCLRGLQTLPGNRVSKNWFPGIVYGPIDATRFDADIRVEWYDRPLSTGGGYAGTYRISEYGICNVRFVCRKGGKNA